MLDATTLLSAQAKRPGFEKTTIERTNSTFQRHLRPRPGLMAKDCQLGSKSCYQKSLR